jgi:two-component system CheB/CheR fusion protein
VIELIAVEHEPAQVAPIPAPLALHPRPLRILVVEDHEDTARMMCTLLRKRRFHVTAAVDVRTALERFESESIDLLISDIALPDGSGLDLMQRLRARGPIAGIALSGHGTEGDVLNSRAAGFAKHLTKPVDFVQLLAAIGDVGDSVPRMATPAE